MKRLAYASFAALLAAGVGLAQPAETGTEELRFRAKHGRSTLTEDARIKAEAANTAYRAAPTTPAGPAASSSEQWFRAKYGRNSPREEARQNDELGSTAYRADTQAERPDPSRSVREMMKAKYGRDLNSKK